MVLPSTDLREGDAVSTAKPLIQSCATSAIPKLKSPFTSLRIGIFAASTSGTSEHIVAIASPASLCMVTFVAILDQNETVGAISDWCTRNRLGSGDNMNEVLKISRGENGFRDMLNDSTIDGVFITGTFDRGRYVELALKANKHVLVDDPITHSLTEFQNLIHLALMRKLHLQDTTMFIYHYGLRKFEERILDKESFGDITKISTVFDINPADARYRGISTPSNSTECWGVIGSLVRYCLVLGNLILLRAGKKAVSARITHLDKDTNGIPLHSMCTITFDGNCTLEIDCSYINYRGTRQTVEVHSATHSATMNDFVFAHRGLASYRLYEKYKTSSDIATVTGGEAIDVEVSERTPLNYLDFYYLSAHAILKTGWPVARSYDLETICRTL